MKKIPTSDATGKPNGYVLPIWNANEQPELRPDQVYLTCVAAHTSKGPHLHMVRRGLFCCIKGNVRVVIRGTASSVEFYKTHYSGENNCHALIPVPAGMAACLYNDSDEEALVINMPSPAWSKDAPDENPVENWNP